MPQQIPSVGQHQLKRAAIAMERLRSWLEFSGYSAVTLTTPAAVSWLTGGIHRQVDSASCTSEVWAVVSGKGAYLIASEVELDRIRAEYQPARLGFDELLGFPWYKPDGAATVAGSIGGTEASDGHPDLGANVNADLIELRLALSEPELDDLKTLGVDVSNAMTCALEAFEPGVSDFEIQSTLSKQLEGCGARTPILIVGGDDRISRYRHPLAQGLPIWHTAMAVVVAERAGLHVAMTRYTSIEPLPIELVATFSKLRNINEEILSACRPGNAYGAVLERMDHAYREAGYPNEWRHHYQGGPIGFLQREFEIAPANHESRWYQQRLVIGTAVAFNPSLPGGAKLEDTYILTESGLDPVTTSKTLGYATGSEFDEFGVLRFRP